MSPLEKAREVTRVRREYEDAATRDERVRLARELERMCRGESTVSADTSQD